MPSFCSAIARRSSTVRTISGVWDSVGIATTFLSEGVERCLHDGYGLTRVAGVDVHRGPVIGDAAQRVQPADQLRVLITPRLVHVRHVGFDPAANPARTRL